MKVVGQVRFALTTSRIRSEPSATDLLPVVGYGGNAPPLLAPKARVLLSHSYP